jgi:hypothetical protein
MSKTVKEDKVGSVHRVKHNGMRFTVTISRDPSLYKFYTDLGLDVFEHAEKVEVKKVEVDDSTGKGHGKRKRNDSVNG